MCKKGFTIIEIVILFLLILGVTFFIIPKNLETTKQAKFISKWIQKYSELEYMFSVIKAQHGGDLHEKINNAKDNNIRKNILLETIKPYLRITSEVKTDYKQYFKNGEEVTPSGKYYFEHFYFTNVDEIVGLKWFNQQCSDKIVCAIMNFDLNGLNPPNKWGYDIFGINIYQNDIEPMGKGIDPFILKKDCYNGGYGVYCAYYYLIGGRFD